MPTAALHDACARLGLAALARRRRHRPRHSVRVAELEARKLVFLLGAADQEIG